MSERVEMKTVEQLRKEVRQAEADLEDIEGQIESLRREQDTVEDRLDKLEAALENTKSAEAREQRCRCGEWFVVEEDGFTSLIGLPLSDCLGCGLELREVIKDKRTQLVAVRS